MADYLYTVEKDTMTAIADAIRDKTGSSETYTATELPAAIAAIEAGVSGGGAIEALLTMEATAEEWAYFDTVDDEAQVDILIPESGCYLCIVHGALATHNSVGDINVHAVGGHYIIKDRVVVGGDRYYLGYGKEPECMDGVVEVVDGKLDLHYTAPTDGAYKLIWGRLYKVDDPSGETITFTVNGIEYTAEAGMTWQQFVESDYNLKSGSEDDCGRMFQLDEYNYLLCIAWYEDLDDVNEDGDLEPLYSIILGGEDFDVDQTPDMVIEPGEYWTDDTADGPQGPQGGDVT